MFTVCGFLCFLAMQSVHASLQCLYDLSLLSCIDVCIHCFLCLLSVYLSSFCVSALFLTVFVLCVFSCCDDVYFFFNFVVGACVLFCHNAELLPCCAPLVLFI